MVWQEGGGRSAAAPKTDLRLMGRDGLGTPSRVRGEPRWAGHPDQLSVVGTRDARTRKRRRLRLFDSEGWRGRCCFVGHAATSTTPLPGGGRLRAASHPVDASSHGDGTITTLSFVSLVKRSGLCACSRDRHHHTDDIRTYGPWTHLENGEEERAGREEICHDAHVAHPSLVPLRASNQQAGRQRRGPSWSPPASSNHVTPRLPARVAALPASIPPP